MKEIENANIMKANATRGSVYTIYKFTLTKTLNIFQVNQQQQQYLSENAHAQAVTIEFSRRDEHEPSNLKI